MERKRASNLLVKCVGFILSTEDNTMNKELKIIRVVAAIIRDGDRILAAQKGYGTFKGGWEFPGGKIEEGELPKEALVRELREEMDLSVDVRECLYTVEYDYPDFHLSMQCFHCVPCSGEFSLKEHLAVKWLTKETIDSVSWLPADVELIKWLKEDWL